MKYAVLLLIVALGTTSYFLKGERDRNGKLAETIGELKTERAVQAATIRGLENEKELLQAFHNVLERIGNLMDEKLAANTDEQKRVLREIQDASLNDQPTQDLLEQRLTDALVRVLCDGGHFHPDIRADVCGSGDPAAVPEELPPGVPRGRDDRAPADVGY